MPGRKRVYDQTIPQHIDQNKIPKGIYWDKSGNGRWFIFETNQAGRKSRTTVAYSNTLLSDLHRIAEELKGINRKSLKWLLEQFNASNKFKELAKETQKHYAKYYKVVCLIETKAGLLGDLDYNKMTSALFQRLVDQVAAKGNPTKANHILRYTRRVFSWGINRGLCSSNPAKGVEQAKDGLD